MLLEGHAVRAARARALGGSAPRRVQGMVFTCKFSPNGKVIASGSFDKEICGSRAPLVDRPLTSAVPSLVERARGLRELRGS
jgi:hypothetical protein